MICTIRKKKRRKPTIVGLRVFIRRYVHAGYSVLALERVRCRVG